MRSKLIAAMETEQANSRMNDLKIKNHWRKIMRSAKMDVLKKDVEILSQARSFPRCDANTIFNVYCPLCASLNRTTTETWTVKTP